MTLARTVTLPVNSGASWDDFAWQPKYPGDVLDYTLDAADWLDGDAIINASYLESGVSVLTMAYVLTDVRQTGVVLTIGGGTAATTALVTIGLTLAGGNFQEILIALPIRADLPAGLIPTPGAGQDDSLLLAL